MKQTEAYQNAQLAAKGLNPDGTINETLTKQLLARSGGGSGSSSIIAYPILDSTGHVNVAHLNPKQLEEIRSAVQGTIKDELGAEQGKEFDKVLISESMLRENTDRFLDDCTLKEVEEAVGKPVQIVRNTGDSFIHALFQTED